MSAPPSRRRERAPARAGPARGPGRGPESRRRGQVEVSAAGDYEVSAGGARLRSGRLGAPVTSTYPGGVIVFSAHGWASLPGSASPRAGHFGLRGAGATATVVVQLLGCVRCVWTDARGSGRPSGGFSLLEVVIAAALLFVTVTAVTATVVGVSRAGARLGGSMDADRAVLSEEERLRALPYCAVGYPQTGGALGETEPDLVAAVFPHAVSAQNSLSARYVATADGSGAPAGSFVTLLTRGDVVVRCVARFLAGPGGPDLAPEQLAGWDRASSDAPPASTLSVALSAEPGGRSIWMVRSALSVPSRPPSSPLPGSG